MTRETISRRKTLKLAGAAAATAAIAGCSDDDDGNGNGNGNGDDNGNDADAWDGVTEFTLLGHSGGWVGDSPDHIDGLDNPTLYLTDGEDYDMTWINDDGINHDFVIEDADGETLEQSDEESEEGAEVELSFTASDDMAEYYCTPHPDAMRGDIEIVEGDGEENGDEENGDEENGDEENGDDNGENGDDE